MLEQYEKTNKSLLELTSLAPLRIDTTEQRISQIGYMVHVSGSQSFANVVVKHTVCYVGVHVSSSDAKCCSPCMQSVDWPANTASFLVRACETRAPF